jgi:hypothetical protein
MGFGPSEPRSSRSLTWANPNQASESRAGLFAHNQCPLLLERDLPLSQGVGSTYETNVIVTASLSSMNPQEANQSISLHFTSYHDMVLMSLPSTPETEISQGRKLGDSSCIVSIVKFTFTILLLVFTAEPVSRRTSGFRKSLTSEEVMDGPSRYILHSSTIVSAENLLM